MILFYDKKSLIRCSYSLHTSKGRSISKYVKFVKGEGEF